MEPSAYTIELFEILLNHIKATNKQGAYNGKTILRKHGEVLDLSEQSKLEEVLPPLFDIIHNNLANDLMIKVSIFGLRHIDNVSNYKDYRELMSRFNNPQPNIKLMTKIDAKESSNMFRTWHNYQIISLILVILGLASGAAYYEGTEKINRENVDLSLDNRELKKVIDIKNDSLRLFSSYIDSIRLANNKGTSNQAAKTAPNNKVGH